MHTHLSFYVDFLKMGCMDGEGIKRMRQIEENIINCNGIVRMHLNRIIYSNHF